MASMNPAAAGPRQDARAAEKIAQETDTPVEVVRLIYDEEFSAISATAKITQYVGVIASRRVRMRLQKH